jgi:probable rRNA maturation factor
MKTIATYEIDIQIEDPTLMPVDVTDLERAATATLAHLDCEDASLTIVITDNEEVARLNREYRQVDGPTDILSFPAQGDDEIFEMPPEIELEVATYLGDLIIAYPFTANQAKRYHNSLGSELRLLVVHGTLHLLGYDHDTEEHQREMWEIQGEVLSALGDTSTNWEREYEP